MARVQPCDLLLVVTGAPYSSSLVTTLFRILHEVLDRGHSARVWTCGYAVMLTQTALTRHKPRDVDDWGRRHPTTMAMIEDLLAEFPRTLSWEACGFCSQDRAATGHLSGVRVRPPSRIASNVGAAASTIYIGGS